MSLWHNDPVSKDEYSVQPFLYVALAQRPFPPTPGRRKEKRMDLDARVLNPWVNLKRLLSRVWPDKGVTP